MRIIATLVFSIVAILTSAQEVEIPKESLIGMSMEEQLENGYIDQPRLYSALHNNNESFALFAEDCSETLIPVESDYIAVPRNDDGSLYIDDIGFEFSFCGEAYTHVYINTNGNISFTQGVSQYSPDGFPYDVPMVAPFWADVDTRNASCGQAWYKLFPNYMIVTWDSVGWYNLQCSPLNKFQLIISDGTADIIGQGKNIQFRYDEMEWTTGQASGGGPFGGSPATVGYNSGDNENFEQIGRFNQDSDVYDGPYGENDGVHYLDFKCFTFNANIAGEEGLNLSCQSTTVDLGPDCHYTLAYEDISSFKSNGCEAIDVELDITDFFCGDVGTHLVLVTASSSNVTETCTANVTVTNNSCQSIFINPEGPLCESDDAIVLSATPPGGTWSGAVNSSLFDPSLLGPGLHSVTYTNTSACPESANIEIEVLDGPTVVTDPSEVEFCEDDDPFIYPITATAFGGDNNYSFTWETPFGNTSGNTVFPQEEGSYVVQVIDGNSCTNTAEAEVTIHPLPTVNIEDPGPICNDLEVFALTGTPPGGYFNGSVETSEGLIYPNQLAPTSYTVNYVYIDGNGCEASQSRLIEIIETPEALAASNSPVCVGDVIFLYGNSSTNQSGESYTWTGPNGYISYEKTASDATEPGIYTLTVESIYGCVSEPVEIEIIQTEEPEITTTDGSMGCDGVSTQLFAISNVTNPDYYWEGPNGFISEEQNPIVSELGMYYVTVSLSPTCINVDSAEVITDNTVPDIEASGNTITCNEPVVEIVAQSNTNNAVIEWHGPNGYIGDESSAMVNEEGTYLAIVIGPNGCRDSLEVMVDTYFEYANLDYTEDTLDCFTSVLELNLESDLENVTYLWEGPNGFSSEDSNPSVDVDGNYHVTVTTETGCESYASLQIGIDTLVANVDLDYNELSCAATSTLISLLDKEKVSSLNWTGPNGFATSGDSIEVDQMGEYQLEATFENGCIRYEIIEIEGNFTLPEISATSDTISCISGIATAVATTNDSDVSLQWKNSQGVIVGTGDSISVGASGLYTCIIRHNLSGCADSVQIMVEQDVNVPDINALGTVMDCSASNFFVEANSQSAISIEWEGPNGFISNQNSPEVFEAGTYSVTATSANGCKAVETVEVIDDTGEPEIALYADSITCDRSEVFLLMDETGNGNSYQWEGPAGFQSNQKEPIIVEGGIYSVTVTSSNSCSSVRNIEVIENTIIPELVSQSSNDLNCTQMTTVLSANSNHPQATFIWTDIDGNTHNGAQLETNRAGEYFVEVRAPNGCSETNSVLVGIDTLYPQIDVESIVLNCYSPTAFFNPVVTQESDATFSWTGPLGFASQEVNPQISFGGEFELIVENSNGCRQSLSLSVDEDFELPETEVDMVGFDCFGNDAILSTQIQGDQFSYLWISESAQSYTESMIAVQEPGWYDLTVLDESNGCEFNTQVYLDAIDPVIDFEIESRDPGCSDPFGEINIMNVEGGGSGMSYSIDNGENFQDNPQFPGLLPGLYSILVMDDNGCEVSKDLELVQQSNFTIETTTSYVTPSGADLDIIVDSPIDTENLDSIIWSPSISLSCDDCLDPVFNGYQSVRYELTLIDEFGCRDQVEILVRVVLKDVYFPNAFSPNEDQVNDFFTIYGDEQQVEDVINFSVYDRWGNQLYTNDDLQINDPTQGWDGRFNGRYAVSGVYVYRAKIKMINGDIKDYMGDITLVK